MSRKWTMRIVAVAILAWPTYWLLVQAAIRYCAHDLTRSHGCMYSLFNSGDETRFLKRMGVRSVPALERHIDDPSVPLHAKIHLAWVLSSIGNHTRFSVFIAGLNSSSDRTRFIAVERMMDFPSECMAHLAEILRAGMAPQHEEYWAMLNHLVDRAALDPERHRALLKKVAQRNFVVPFTANTIDELLADFGSVNADEQPTGTDPARVGPAHP